jgi:hypothetical protein
VPVGLHLRSEASLPVPARPEWSVGPAVGLLDARSSAAPERRRWTTRRARMLRTALNERSVNSGSSHSERPAAYRSTMKPSARACTLASGRHDPGAPANSGSGLSCGRRG